MSAAAAMHISRRASQSLKAIVLAAVIALSSHHAYAQMSPSVQRGLNFAQANCARCHAIDKVGPSPLKIAPPFRTLHSRYPVETLAESLSEGIVTAHQNMPQFRLDADQITDFISYLKWLEQ
jgi:mono/diheme cytochrome c family protein